MTSNEPSGEPTTPPTQSTESQSTSATEDSVPVSEEENSEATAAVNNEEHPQSLNITEQDIETSKRVLERQINQTKDAVTLLQSESPHCVTAMCMQYMANNHRLVEGAC